MTQCSQKVAVPLAHQRHPTTPSLRHCMPQLKGVRRSSATKWAKLRSDGMGRSSAATPGRPTRHPHTWPFPWTTSGTRPRTPSLRHCMPQRHSTRGVSPRVRLSHPRPRSRVTPRAFTKAAPPLRSRLAAFPEGADAGMFLRTHSSQPCSAQASDAPPTALLEVFASTRFFQQTGERQAAVVRNLIGAGCSLTKRENFLDANPVCCVCG